MNLLKSLLTHPIAERAIKTFVQAFVASLVVSGFAFDKTILLAALAAGLSATWNYLRTV